jgi:hypothetical protein
MRDWTSVYTAICNANVGKTITRDNIMAALTVGGYPTNSQGPTDYRGVFDTRETIDDGTGKQIPNPSKGKVVRVGSQSTQYKPLIFAGTGNDYFCLPVEKRVANPGTRGTTLQNATPAQLQAALKAAGVVNPFAPAPAPAPAK